MQRYLDLCNICMCTRIRKSHLCGIFDFFSVVAVAVSICEDDRKLHIHRMCAFMSVYQNGFERIEEKRMEWAVEWKQIMTTMSVSAYTQRIRLYAVDNAFFLLPDLYELCGSFSLCVFVDRHIKLPSMCRIVCFINTHISFNRQVKLHLFSCLCLHSKMHSQIYRQMRTQTAIGSSRNICSKHLLVINSVDGFFLSVLFLEKIRCVHCFTVNCLSIEIRWGIFCVDINLFTNVGKYSFSDYWVWACACLTTRKKNLKMKIGSEPHTQQ